MKFYLKYYYLFLLYTWSFVDIITGYNLHNENIAIFNVAQISRTILLFLSLIIIFLKANGKELKLILIISLILTLLFLKIFYYKFPFNFAYTQVKTFSWIFNIYALFLLFRSKLITLSNIYIALKINFFLILVNIMLAYFGFGYSKYGESEDGSIIGSIGYFYSGNELNSALFLCFSIFYYKTRSNFKNFLKFSLLFLIITFATLSKSIIGGYFFITLLSLFQLHNKLNLKSFLILLFTGIIIYISLVNISNINLYIESFKFLYDRTDNIFEFISNGRNLRFEVFSLSNFFNNPVNIFIGTYFSESGIFTFEMDYLDIFFYNGISGLILIFVCWKLYYSMISTNINPSEKKFILYVLYFFNLIAFFAGHTIYSQMSLLFLMIFLLITYDHQKKII